MKVRGDYIVTEQTLFLLSGLLCGATPSKQAQTRRPPDSSFALEPILDYSNLSSASITLPTPNHTHPFSP